MTFSLNSYMNQTSDTKKEQLRVPPIHQHVNPSPVGHKSANEADYEAFFLLCENVKSYIQEKSKEQQEEWNRRQKLAILGYQKEVDYYLREINFFIEKEKKQYISFPPWYDNLTEGVFHENWGLAGIWEWIKHSTSSSCKIVQPRIYFLENGVTTLKPQRLSAERFNALKTALLLNDTSQSVRGDYQEVYMVDGTRIEIYNNHKKSSGEGVIVFRRYTVKDYSLENLAELGTLGHESVNLIKSMVNCGFNVNMIGPVRSGKTTFMTAYQLLEDPTLEGVLVETDPEIPLHVLMPSAPIMQLIADNEKLETLVKPLMRSDADYLIMGEARDGRALRLMLMLTKKGTRHVKATFHTGQAQDFCYDVAQEIVNIYGGNIWAYMIQIATNFDFLFEFISDPDDKSKKRLKGIHEIRFIPETMLIQTNAICLYDLKTKAWSYHGELSDKTRINGYSVNREAFEVFEQELARLAKEYPMDVEPIRTSPFSRLVPTN